jgi:eukaryotic-like serine/threonine-protein kinase
MPLTTGTHLGPYEIVAPIGAGGMGEVYLACDRFLVLEASGKSQRVAARSRCGPG